MRSYIEITLTPQGAPLRRAGYTLTIFRKMREGRWVLSRDANLLTAV